MSVYVYGIDFGNHVVLYESSIDLHGLVPFDILDDHSKTNWMNANFEGTSISNLVGLPTICK